MHRRDSIQNRRVIGPYDEEMTAFLKEIGECCEFPSTDYPNINLRQFIELCRCGQNAHGTPKSSRTVKPPWPMGVLASRVGKLFGSVKELIEELCQAEGLSIEVFDNSSVAAAINKLTKPKKNRR